MMNVNDLAQLATIAGTIIGIIGLFLTIFVLVWKAGQWSGRKNERFDAIDKQFGGVDKRFDGVDKQFGAVDKRFDGVNQQFNGVDKRFDSVDKRFEATDKRLASIERRMDALPGQIMQNVRSLLIEMGFAQNSGQQHVDNVNPESPLTLTKKGAKIARKMGAKNMVQKYCEQVELNEDPSPFNIQRATQFFTMDKFMTIVTPEEKQMIENVAYEDGGNLAGILVIFAVMIRDEIFKKHGIAVPKRKAAAK